MVYPFLRTEAAVCCEEACSLACKKGRILP